MKKLVLVVDRHYLPRLSVNRVRNKDVLIQNAGRDRSRSAPKIQIGSKNVVPLCANVNGGCTDRNRRAARGAGPLQVAGGATAGSRRLRAVASIRLVGDVFPFAVAD